MHIIISLTVTATIKKVKAKCSFIMQANVENLFSLLYLNCTVIYIPIFSSSITMKSLFNYVILVTLSPPSFIPIVWNTLPPFI